MPNRPLIWGALLVALSASPVARAQDNAARRALLQEAVAEYEAQRWAEARALFAQAHRMQGSANALRLMGSASYELRDYPLAIRHLEDALAFNPPLPAHYRAEAERVLMLAKRFVAIFRVEVAPPNAAVTLDGVATTERRLILTPGRYTIEANAPGYQSSAQSISVVGGEAERALTFNLQPDAAPTPPEPTPTPTPTPTPFQTQPTPQPTAGQNANVRDAVREEWVRARQAEQEQQRQREARQAEIDGQEKPIAQRRNRGRRLIISGAAIGMVGLAITPAVFLLADEVNDCIVRYGGFDQCENNDDSDLTNYRITLGTVGVLTGVGGMFVLIGGILRLTALNALKPPARRLSAFNCGIQGIGVGCEGSF